MTDPIAVQMKAIHERWGAVIAAACKTLTPAGTVPPALLAAIVANESNGDPSAKRFESAVLVSLWDVLMGRKAAFGSIGRKDLSDVLFPVMADEIRCYSALDALATSWGLTQIMGYNFLAGVDKLTDPNTNLNRAVGMLADFAKQYDLSFAIDAARHPPGSDAADLLNCWNTGHPVTSPTPDEYVQNGLARMAAYQAILNAPDGAS